MIPTWWISLVLVLAAFRVTRLIGWDDFPPIARYRARWTGEVIYYDDATGAIRAITYRRKLLGHFLACAYCLGFWISLATYLAWRWYPTQTVYACAPFALSAAVGIVARNLDK